MEEHSLLNMISGYSDEPAKLRQIDEHYRYEDLLMESVMWPDPEKCREALRGLEQTYYRNVFPPRFPNDPVSEYRESTLRLNTVLRIAARRGGLPPVFLHAISDGFAFRIYRMRTVGELEPFREYMAHYYVNGVSEYSINRYSDEVGEIISYINYHLLDKISLSELAQQFHFSESYLSRRFKRETGFNLSSFVVRSRVELAKQYFRMGYKSVTQVSQLCGFSDSGYFQKVFKKIEGETPSKFIAGICRDWNEVLNTP